MTRSVLVLLAALTLSACSLVSMGSGTLGGRQKCWSPEDKRIPSLMAGKLELASIGYSNLEIPDDDDLQLTFSSMYVDQDELGFVLKDARGSTVAVDDEVVTLFGGIGSDETMVVCDVEEREAGSE